MANPQQYSPAQLNAIARQAIRQNAVLMTQQIASNTYVPANAPTIQIQPRNVGLILGFWMKVVHVVHNGSGVQLDVSDFGPANALSNIQFSDLNNTLRINTPGWHMAFVNSAKARRPFGSSFVRTTGFVSGRVNYGDNFSGQISAPATIAAGADGTVTMWYWIPLAYTQDDLRGAVYANVVNGTMNLQVSFPGNNGVSIAVANGTDSTLAMYFGDIAGSVAAVTISSSTVTTYQVYYDQIPVVNGQLLIPLTDIGTIYEMKQTTIVGAVANQDFPYQYANFRDFLSTFAVYVNTGATGARTGGTDINYWGLQSANNTFLWKTAPDLQALKTRQYMGVDFPNGVYYFPTRERPISTVQYGNMQLVNNPITAGAAGYQLVATEDFALIQTLSMAGSLQAT